MRSTLNSSRFVRGTMIVALGVVVFSATFGILAANSVPTTRLGRSLQSQGADNIKPSDCAGITVSVVTTGVTGTAGNDLLLATSAGELTISGGGGNDCIHGGGGNDVISGGTGTDVCIGGTGTDTFNLDCETQVQ